MENTIFELQNLFNQAIFQVPQYQRAYSWDLPQLKAFLNDLRQESNIQSENKSKKYYLGTLLLHSNKKEDLYEIIDIVDGQQRLTTAVIFVATYISTINVESYDRDVKMLRRAFVFDDDCEAQKFNTILEDGPLFRAEILNLPGLNSGVTTNTKSAERLRFAKKFFSENVEKNEWPFLLDKLRRSSVMVYSVNNHADATQIFELQNDRGKKLTDLESIKSYLMHSVYLYSKNPDNKLTSLQASFSKIFRSIEALEQQIHSKLDEDSALSYHCAAFSAWSDNGWRYPKQLVKDLVTGQSVQDRIIWIENFVNDLVISLASFVEILESRDKITELAELYVLGRMAPFWPLLLKGWILDKDKSKNSFKSLCKVLEAYSFRGYAISNLRSDSGASTFLTKARDFSGDFDALIKEIVDMCSWYDIDNRFVSGLNSEKIYLYDLDDAKYLLWRYENSLRKKTGNQHPQLSWRDYLTDFGAVSFTLEHIMAQDDAGVNSDVQWDSSIVKPFSEVALHRLGNLVIDSLSPNASKGNKPFKDKIPHFTSSSYLSQAELVSYASENELNEKTWDVTSVKKRHEHLVDFAISEWDPKKHIKNNSTRNP